MKLEVGDYFIIKYWKRWQRTQRSDGMGGIKTRSGVSRFEDRSMFDLIFEAKQISDTLVCAEVVAVQCHYREDEIGQVVALRVAEFEPDTVAKSEVEFCKLIPSVNEQVDLRNKKRKKERL